MARIAYDTADAAAFAAARHLTADGLSGWRDAVTRHLAPRPGTRLLDLGAGTGSWSASFLEWFPGIEVTAVEPSPAMRALCAHPGVLAGDAGDIPIGDAGVDAVWLSTVIHHIPDLPAAAREIRRVLRPGGVVLIRSAFAGRSEAITLFRFFPAAIRVLDTFPGVPQVEAAFRRAGLTLVADEQVPQVTAGSLREAAAGLRREAHTPLQLITDEEYAVGVADLERAALHETGPVIDALDLLVLR